MYVAITSFDIVFPSIIHLSIRERLSWFREYFWWKEKMPTLTP